MVDPIHQALLLGLLVLVLVELTLGAGAWFRANHGGRHTPGGGFVAIHVRFFGGLVAGLVMLCEAVEHVWVRIDPIYRASGALTRVLSSRGVSYPAPLWRPSTVTHPPACNGRRAIEAGGLLGVVVAMRARVGEWAERLFTAGIGLFVGAIVGALSAIYTGHDDQVLPSLIACGLFGAAFGFVAYASDAASRHDGMASGRELRRSMSARQVRRTARITRPGLERPGQSSVREYGVALVRKGQAGRWLYASLKDVILLVAPTQTGKTALLGNTVIDAPGAVVATSTKPDIFEHTAAVRSGPLHVLNPEGLAGIPTTLRWSPIEGCERPSVAIERAGYLLAGAPSSGDLSDRNFWDGMNARLLRSLLYAAAVSCRDMHALYSWVSDPGDETPLRILRRHHQTPAGWELDLEQIRQAPIKTRDSAYLTTGAGLSLDGRPRHG
jgi:hypothetical protein